MSFKQAAILAPVSFFLGKNQQDLTHLFIILEMLIPFQEFFSSALPSTIDCFGGKRLTTLSTTVSNFILHFLMHHLLLRSALCLDNIKLLLNCS